MDCRIGMDPSRIDRFTMIVTVSMPRRALVGGVQSDVLSGARAADSVDPLGARWKKITPCHEGRAWPRVAPDGGGARDITGPAVVAI